jgi:hypothetical protein
VVLNFYIHIKIHVVTFDIIIMPSMTAHRKSIAVLIQKLPDSVDSQLVQIATDRVNVSGETITLVII